MLRRSQRKRPSVPLEGAEHPVAVKSEELSPVCWYKTRHGNDAFTYRSIRFPGTLFRYVSSQGNRHNNQATRRFVCVSCSKVNNNRCSNGQRSLSASGVSVRDGNWLDDPDFPYWEHICIAGLQSVDWPPKGGRHVTNYHLPEVDGLGMLKQSHEGLTVLDELKNVHGDLHALSTLNYRHLIRVLSAGLFERSNRQIPPLHERRAYMQAFFSSIGAVYDMRDQKTMASVNMRIRRLLSKALGGDNDESSVFEDGEEKYAVEGGMVSMFGGDSMESSEFDFEVDQLTEDNDHYDLDYTFSETVDPQPQPEKKMKTEPITVSGALSEALQLPPADESHCEYVNEESVAATSMHDDFLVMEETNFAFVEPNSPLMDDIEASGQFARNIAPDEITSRFVAMGVRPPTSPSFEQIWNEVVANKLINFGKSQNFAAKGIERFLHFKNAAEVEHLSLNDRSELAFRLLPIALFGNDHGYFSKHLTKVFIDCHANMKTPLQDPRQFYTSDDMNHPVIIRVSNKYALVVSNRLISVDGGFATALRLLVEAYSVLSGDQPPFEVYLVVKFLQYIYEVDRDKVSEEHKGKFEMVLSFC